MDIKDYREAAKKKMELDPYIGKRTPLKSYSPPLKRKETESQKSLQKLIAQQIWSSHSDNPYDYLFQLDWRKVLIIRETHEFVIYTIQQDLNIIADADSIIMISINFEFD